MNTKRLFAHLHVDSSATRPKLNVFYLLVEGLEPLAGACETTQTSN